MAKDDAVRQAARTFLPWVALGPLTGIASWMFDGIFIGATLTREMRNTMILSVAVGAVAFWVLLPAFGNHGLWVALMVLNATRGLTMAALYGRVEAKAGQCSALCPAGTGPLAPIRRQPSAHRSGQFFPS
jgi:MATE family multidrug resistance protein